VGFKRPDTQALTHLKATALRKFIKIVQGTPRREKELIEDSSGQHLFLISFYYVRAKLDRLILPGLGLAKDNSKISVCLNPAIGWEICPGNKPIQV